MAAFEIEYVPPGGGVLTLTVGHRAAELLRLLAPGGRYSRLRMIEEGAARIGLNAPSTISYLIKLGFVILKHRVKKPWSDGIFSSFVEYQIAKLITDIRQK